MAGIYIHIPYCKTACHYCNFHFSVNSKTQNDFVNALLREIALQENYLQGEHIETIYFGGGTPSVLDIQYLHKILNEIYLRFRVLPDAEITLEANPDDISEEKIVQLKRLGITRFSMGIQSFFDEDLKWMNRSHDAEAAKKSLYQVCEAGFQNTNIDLIYGLPDMTQKRWQQNIEMFLQFDLPHLSAYCLTVEQKTALHKMVKTGKTTVADDTAAMQHFDLLIELMQGNGYEHYEISNFSKPREYSKHNTAYWFGKKYLGLGASAHSFNGNSRQWNIANNMKYINSLLKEDILFFEKEQLTVADRFNELLMTRLRTQWGVDMNLLQQNFPPEMLHELNEAMQPYIMSGHLQFENSIIKLTHKGKFVADRLVSDLMVV